MEQQLRRQWGSLKEHCQGQGTYVKHLLGCVPVISVPFFEGSEDKERE